MIVEQPDLRGRVVPPPPAKVKAPRKPLTGWRKVPAKRYERCDVCVAWHVVSPHEPLALAAVVILYTGGVCEPLWCCAWHAADLGGAKHKAVTRVLSHVLLPPDQRNGRTPGLRLVR